MSLHKIFKLEGPIHITFPIQFDWNHISFSHLKKIDGERTTNILSNIVSRRFQEAQIMYIATVTKRSQNREGQPWLFVAEEEKTPTVWLRNLK